MSTPLFGAPQGSVLSVLTPATNLTQAPTGWQTMPLVGADNGNGTASLSANVYSRSSSITANPTVTSGSAYAIGNIVGGLLALANAFGPACSGIIQSASVVLKSTQTVALKLYVFSANPSNSTWNDKSAPAINAADVSKLAGVYGLTAYDSGAGTCTLYNLDSIGKQITSASTTLYAVLVTTAAITFASTSDVFVSVGVLQD
jgi:hypothetical protein